MGKKIEAIVRGPENYFDDRLYAPGQRILVDEDFVSEDEFIEAEITVPLAKPVVQDGRLITEAKKIVRKRTRFRPVGSMPQAAQPTTTAQVATGNPDRLNVTDFLKQSDDHVSAAIASGSVDDHLGVIEQGVIAGKRARGDVKDAIAARRAAIARP